MRKTFKFCSLMLTDHAEARAHQRGFNFDDFELLLMSGDGIADVGGGAVAYTMTRKALDDLDPEERKTSAAQKALKTAVVVSDNVVITATNLTDKEKTRHLRGRHKNGHPHRPRSRRGAKHAPKPR
jgi:hypothetical protein